MSKQGQSRTFRKLLPPSTLLGASALDTEADIEATVHQATIH